MSKATSETGYSGTKDRDRRRDKDRRDKSLSKVSILKECGHAPKHQDKTQKRGDRE